MTLILAASGTDGTFIGADSRVSTDYSQSDGHSKLVRVHNYILGVAGSSRVSQLIEYQTDSFSPIEQDADMFFFSACLKQLMADDHAVQAGSEHTEKFTVLVATVVGIYSLHRNFQFHHHPESWAVGAGDDYGLGYFRGLSTTSTTERIRTAIGAAAAYVPGVGGPVDVLRV
jgi:hypothetical protein